MAEESTTTTAVCQNCASEWPQGSVFCGSCGAALPKWLPDPATTASAAGGRRDIPPVVASHLTPTDGIQAYVEPDAHAALGPYVPVAQPVMIAETRGLWARVCDADRQLGWIDGRRLEPPAVSDAASVASASPVATGSAAVGSAIGAISGVGVMVGAAVDWLSGGSSNAFEIPLPWLFDSASTEVDPKLGYFVVTFGLAGLVFAFVRRAGFVRVLSGALALVLAILYVARIADLQGSSVDLAEVLGPGPWVTGISALVLLVSPLIGWRSAPTPTPSGVVNV